MATALLAQGRVSPRSSGQLDRRWVLLTAEPGKLMRGQREQGLPMPWGVRDHQPGQGKAPSVLPLPLLIVSRDTLLPMRVWCPRASHHAMLLRWDDARHIAKSTAQEAWTEVEYDCYNSKFFACSLTRLYAPRIRGKRFS
jgi:hypothetical protein